MKQPLIKLFETCGNYYFYDANQDSVCNIDQNTYKNLEKIYCGEEINYDEQILNLINEGYLNEFRPRNIRHPMTDFVEEALNNNMHQLVLQVTQACNLSCSYCPYANSNNELQRKASNKRMSIKVAHKAIDYFAEHAAKEGNVYIGFYGGEPLLDIEFIKDCVDYAEIKLAGKRLGFSITTNGTLLDDETIDYLYCKHFILMFSVDGPKVIHDANRKTYLGEPTYDVVFGNLEKTIDKYGEDSKKYLTVNMVFDTNSSFEQVLLWLRSPIFKNVNIRFNLVDDEQLNKKNKGFNDYYKLVRYKLAEALMVKNGIIAGDIRDLIIEQMAERYMESRWNFNSECVEGEETVSVGGACISGARKLFVNVDGVFYPCEKVNELSDEMIIGNVDLGINVNAVKKQINLFDSYKEECLNCWAYKHCDQCQKVIGNPNYSSERQAYCDDVKNALLDKLKKKIILEKADQFYKKWRNNEHSDCILQK